MYAQNTLHFPKLLNFKKRHYCIEIVVAKANYVTVKKEICQRWANVSAEIGPTLAQSWCAIWV